MVGADVFPVLVPANAKYGGTLPVRRAIGLGLTRSNWFIFRSSPLILLFLLLLLSCLRCRQIQRGVVEGGRRFGGGQRW